MNIRTLPLVDFEHQLHYAFMLMEKKGLHVDQEYAAGYLSDTFTRRYEDAMEVCKQHGIDSVHKPKAVASALQSAGANLTKRTKTGFSTDKEVLSDLVIDDNPEVVRLATAIQDAKSAIGFRTKYVEKVLDALDPEGRVHPSHTSIQARTARTAVSDPPLHQLPSRDNPGGNPWEVRRMFDAAPGHQIITADFDQIELVVLAGLSGDRNLIRAIQNGDDLHQITADAANVPRPIGKMTNFLIVYGGGHTELVRRAKMSGFTLSVEAAKRTIKAFKRLYPGVGRLAKSIQQAFLAGRKYVKTPTGRILPIDRQRVYAGLNYYIQSTARDVMGQGCINLREAGYWQYVTLTIHDEYKAEVPDHMIEEYREAVPEIIKVTNFLGKEIDITGGCSDPVPTWGHLYLADGETMPV